MFRVLFLVTESPDGRQERHRLTAEQSLAIVAATNFKQRTRKMLEYYHADRLNFAVAGTPNRLEYDQGFFVKNGDGAADVKPIAHLYKSQVYQLAEYLDDPGGGSQPASHDRYVFAAAEPGGVLLLAPVRDDGSLPLRAQRRPAGRGRLRTRWGCPSRTSSASSATSSRSDGRRATSILAAQLVEPVDELGPTDAAPDVAAARYRAARFASCCRSGGCGIRQGARNRSSAASSSARELDRRGGHVLPEMREIGRSGNRDERRRAVQEPGERDLRRRGVVGGRDPLQRRLPRFASAPFRSGNHETNAMPAPSQTRRSSSCSRSARLYRVLNGGDRNDPPAPARAAPDRRSRSRCAGSFPRREAPRGLRPTPRTARPDRGEWR